MHHYLGAHTERDHQHDFTHVKYSINALYSQSQDIFHFTSRSDFSLGPFPFCEPEPILIKCLTLRCRFIFSPLHPSGSDLESVIIL